MTDAWPCCSLTLLTIQSRSHRLWTLLVLLDGKAATCVTCSLHCFLTNPSNYMWCVAMVTDVIWMDIHTWLIRRRQCSWFLTVGTDPWEHIDPRRRGVFFPRHALHAAAFNGRAVFRCETFWQKKDLVRVRPLWIKSFLFSGYFSLFGAGQASPLTCWVEWWTA